MVRSDKASRQNALEVIVDIAQYTIKRTANLFIYLSPDKVKTILIIINIVTLIFNRVGLSGQEKFYHR